MCEDVEVIFKLCMILLLQVPYDTMTPLQAALGVRQVYIYSCIDMFSLCAHACTHIICDSTVVELWHCLSVKYLIMNYMRF